MKKIVTFIILTFIFITGITFNQTGTEIKVKASSNDSELAKSLYSAVQRGDLEDVRELISKGADVNWLSYMGNTPLLVSVKNRDLAITRLLIQTGVYDLETPLMVAVDSGYEEEIELLIDAGAQLNIRRPSGYPVFVDAVHTRNERIVQMFIDAGVNINIATDYGLNALIAAAEEGYTSIVQILINAGAQQGKTTALCEAVYGYNVKIVKLLIKEGANYNIQDRYGNTLLIDAIDKNYLEIARILIDVGIVKQDEALWESATHNNIEITKLLIAAGADFRRRNPDSYGQTPLIATVEVGYLQMAKLLIDAGARLEVEDNYGYTPLICASINGDKDMVHLLIDEGADIHHINKDGETALYHAKRMSNHEIVDILKNAE